MSTSVSWNGSSYTVPSTSEENWSGATKVDGLLIALATHGFQKTGGTFTLSADADFGVSAGLKSIYYKSRGTVATTGVLRLGNTEVIAWRNAADSANIPLTVNSSDQLTFNGTVVLSSGGVVQIAAGGTGQTTAAAAFNALSPMTTLGDIIYGGASGTRTRLAGNTSATKTYLSQTGDGANSAAPSWTQPAFSELSGNATVAQGGTDVTSYTAGDLLYASGSTTLTKLGIGTAGQILQTNAGASAPEWATNASAADRSYELTNLAFTLTVGTGALTIALKGKDGNDPSGSNIVGVGFRSATVTSGVYVRRTVTGALSLVVPSGATLGFVDGVTSYAYIYLIDNAGTVELGVSGIVLDEGTVQTSTTIGTGSDSISGFYSTTGRTSKAIRLIGRVKFSLTTAGTWDETGDELSLIPFTNQLVAALYESNSATSITNNSATIVNFEDKIYDTHNAVTVGASWSYTARVAGVYSVKSFVELASNTGWEAAETAELQLFKNGSIYRALGTKTMETNNPGGYVMSLWGSSSLSLAVGDTVDIRVLQNSDGAINTSTSPAYVWVAIERIGQI